MKYIFNLLEDQLARVNVIFSFVWSLLALFVGFKNSDSYLIPWYLSFSILYLFVAYVSFLGWKNAGSIFAGFIYVPLIILVYGGGADLMLMDGESHYMILLFSLPGVLAPAAIYPKRNLHYYFNVIYILLFIFSSSWLTELIWGQKGLLGSFSTEEWTFSFFIGSTAIFLFWFTDSNKAQSFDQGERLNQLLEHYESEVEQKTADYRAASKDLSRNTTHLSNIINAVPDMLWIKDPNGVYSLCNGEFEKFIGLDQSEIIGKSDRDLFEESYALTIEDTDRQALEEEKITYERDITYFGESNQRSVEITKALVIDSQGETTGVLGVSRDITERKKLMAEVQSEKTKLNQLIKGVNGVFWEYDTDLQAITYVSDQAYEFWGIANGYYGDLNDWFNHVHPEDLDYVKGAMEKAMMDQSSDHIVFRGIHADGTTLWVSSYLSCWQEGKGQGRKVSCIFIDTTSMVETKERLVALESRYESLYNSISDGIYLLDMQGTFLDANEGALKMSGYQREELVGHFIGKLNPRFSTPEDVHELIETFEPGKSYVINAIHVAKDGKEIPVEVNVKILENGGNHTLLAIARDLTERKAQQTQFRAMVEQSPYGIALVSEKGTPYLVNKSLSEMLGYKNEELMKMTFKEFTHPDDFEKDMNLYSKLITNNVSSYTVEQRYISKTGKIVPAKLTVTEIQDPFADNGKRALAMVENLTDIKEEEEKRLRFELKYQNLLLIAPNPCYLIKSDGTIIEANKEAERILGYGDSEIIGMMADEIDGESSLKDLRKFWNEMVPDQVYDFRTHHIHKSEELIPVEVHAVIVKNDQETLIFEIATDLREKIEHDRLINEKNQSLERAQKMAKLGSWKLELKTGRLHWSDEVFRIFEEDDMSVEGSLENFYEYVHPEERAYVRAYFVDRFEKKRDFQLIHRIITRKQNIKFVEEKVRFDKSTYGDPIAIGAVQDVTESENLKLRMEQDISKLKLALITGKLVAFDYIARQDRLMAVRNEYELRDVGLKTKSLKKLADLTRIIRKEFRVHWEKKMASLISREINYFTYQIQCKHVKGYAWYSIYASVTEFEDNYPKNIFIMLRDIEDERSNEIRRIMSQEQERLRISRDIHDSIGQMLVGTRLTLKTKPPELQKQLEDLDEMLDDVIRESRLIINNFGVSVLESTDLRKAFVSLAEKMNKVYPGEIKIDWHGHKKVMDMKIATNVFRVYQEALSNAIRYSGSDRIRVNMRNYDQPYMDVIDFGRGFDLSDFNPGFGTQNMKERAREVNGRLQIESTVSKGTCVRLRLN